MQTTFPSASSSTKLPEILEEDVKRVEDALEPFRMKVSNKNFLYSGMIYRSMTHSVDISRPNNFGQSGGMSIGGKFKQILFTLFRPVLKIVMVNQQNLNHDDLKLAHMVTILEARIQELETEVALIRGEEKRNG